MSPSAHMNAVSMSSNNSYQHPLAEVEEGAQVGDGTKVWDYAKIRTKAIVGLDCMIGRNVFIDEGVYVGARCKIQNNALLYRGTHIQEEVFIGPGVIITNDKYPAAVNDDGTPKGDKDWKCEGVVILPRAVIGAGAILLPGITIGARAKIGAGAVVTKDVPDGAEWYYGNPAR